MLILFRIYKEEMTMVIYQKYNSFKKAWVVFKQTKKDGSRIMNMKTKEPTKPFNGIPIRR